MPDRIGSCLLLIVNIGNLISQEPNKRTSEPNFGRFYTTSYLDGAKSNYLQRSSVQEKERQKSPHFHRPGLSYTKTSKCLSWSSVLLGQKLERILIYDEAYVAVLALGNFTCLALTVTDVFHC